MSGVQSEMNFRIGEMQMEWLWLWMEYVSTTAIQIAVEYIQVVGFLNSYLHSPFARTLGWRASHRKHPAPITWLVIHLFTVDVFEVEEGQSYLMHGNAFAVLPDVSMVKCMEIHNWCGNKVFGINGISFGRSNYKKEVFFKWPLRKISRTDSKYSRTDYKYSKNIPFLFRHLRNTLHHAHMNISALSFSGRR